MFDFIGVCLYFGLRRWICISFWDAVDEDFVTRGPSILKSSSVVCVDFIGVSLYFGLRRWICISFCDSVDVDSVTHGPSILKSSIAALLRRCPRFKHAIVEFCDSCVVKRT